MADNIQVTEGAGKTIATDDISSVHYPRNKLVHGADGTNDGDVSRVNGLPVSTAQCATTEDLTTIAFGSVTNSFASCALTNITTSTSLYVFNDTDKHMLFNFDNGANAEFIVGAGKERLVPIKNGATQAYIKYAAAPTSGNIYLEVRK